MGEWQCIGVVNSSAFSGCLILSGALWWSICSNLLPILKIRLLLVEFCDFFIHFDTSHLLDIWLTKFFESVTYLFTLLNRVIHRVKVFHFDEVQFISFFFHFMVCLFGVLPKNSFFLNLCILFIYYFWLCWVFVAAHRLSLVAASGGSSSLRCAGFSLRWLLLFRSMGSRHAGLSSCGTWAQ